MKRIYLIIGGGIIILGLIGFWIYSFLYGNPANTPNSLFTDLGLFGGAAENVTVVDPTLPTTPTVDVTTAKLRQLTTRPVVGMRIITSPEGEVMRYVEAGTGHIYDINLSTGIESRRSQISVPVASEAVVSTAGEFAAIRSGYNNQNEVVLITLSDTTPTSTVLPHQIESFAFNDRSELLFSEFMAGKTEGKAYTPGSGALRRLFTIPFTAAEIVWDTGSTSIHYVYTKPSPALMGYAYRLTSTGLERLPFTGYHLSLGANGDTTLATLATDGTLTSFIYQASTRTTTEVPLTILPEKCTTSGRNSQDWYCAAEIVPPAFPYPDTWYKGSYQANDRLWRLTPGQGATQLVNIEQESGRGVDVIDLTLSADQQMLYFINKNDKTLWVYEL